MTLVGVNRYGIPNYQQGSSGHYIMAGTNNFALTKTITSSNYNDYNKVGANNILHNNRILSVQNGKLYAGNDFYKKNSEITHIRVK